MSNNITIDGKYSENYYFSVICENLSMKNYIY